MREVVGLKASLKTVAKLALVAATSLLVAPPATAVPIQWTVGIGANGHYYDAIAVGGGINWNDAKTAAEALSYLGNPGHLVTITSPEEQAFLNANLPAAAFGSSSVFGYWIGASRTSASAAGPYSWVTGEAFSYTNWNGGEPNGDAAPAGVHFFGQGSPTGTWNDATASIWNFPGYVVEYQPVPEPTSLALLGLGLGLVGFGSSRRRRG